jgi:hypothetical protein
VKTVAEIIPVIGATQRDVENWVGRLTMSTIFQETVRGRARLFSRANTIELAFIAAFVRGGATPSRAVAFARPLVHEAHAGSWEQLLPEWFVFPAGDLWRGVTSNAVDLPAIEKELNAVTLTTVHLKEVVRRVNALFFGECGLA